MRRCERRQRDVRRVAYGGKIGTAGMLAHSRIVISQLVGEIVHAIYSGARRCRERGCCQSGNNQTGEAHFKCL